MKITYKLMAVLGLISIFAFVQYASVPVKSAMQAVQVHLANMAKTNTDLTKYPRSTKKDGTIATTASRDWTSGFFPGSLWLTYEYTKDKKWETLARQWTAGLEKEQFNKGTHDLGFMIFCSFGNGYRLTKDPKYKDIIIQASKSLITRFNKKAGVIRSWDHNRDKWDYPVIIDNMMNLEMLYWASKQTGDPIYANVATTHALTTLKHHFRPDYSSYHVVDYDTVTGQVRKKTTHQGYSDASAWARGQAWGLYGYTVTYRETKDPRFLKQAQAIADFFINHKNTPADKIPYWDFDAPARTDLPRDASAAAITASGLLELSKYSGAKGEAYKKAASQMLASLASPAYLAKANTNNNFILMHSTGHLPGNSEIDVPLNYADYYFIEGLMRWEQMNKAKAPAKAKG
ncbi:glucuronyl hydrolase [Adhaeribacter aerolatus]|uniref:Glucuronyl hydrolase n=1 Tax=Adhaeribacter aerolatus TaxID=670289 RepID=A0A512ASY1_9BACT|nr:glycoside hydrolase family 88 protein [Adhaeribacter aerolatus]GEO02816.1 glucuronyl hydrolase [Adhaeribacter aerolatus]